MVAKLPTLYQLDESGHPESQDVPVAPKMDRALVAAIMRQVAVELPAKAGQAALPVAATWEGRLRSPLHACLAASS